MKEPHKIRQLTIGTHDFPTLIGKPDAKYVDKTDLLFKLVTETETQFFISRPRRFGKSLMLSTLQAMFEGRRELFKGLAIDKLQWECWEEHGGARYPVYNFSMIRANGTTVDKFLAALENLVRDLCDEAGVPYRDRVDATVNFGEFLKAAAQKSPTGRIVVLIDEYDVPVQGFLDDIKSLELVRKTLHDFYEKLKDNSKYIRFLLMTGVTKLAKLSVFSGMNHLKDKSMDSRFATLLGYTPKELDGPLRENVEEFGAKHGWNFKAAKAKILEWYDGYRFSPGSTARVVNPVSLGSLFDSADGKLKSFWETTGSATLVFNRIKASGKIPADFENVWADPMTLDVCDALTLPIESLLYQSGYLTIKEVIPAPEQTPHEAELDPKMESYILAPPNLEIRVSLKRGFISQVLGVKDRPFEALLDKARHQIAAGDIEHFLYESLFGLYASVPVDWKIGDEAEAKRYFLLFASMCGANPQPEVASIFGYADAVIETPDNVFVFEFKYKRSAKAALKQIKDRNYAAKWLGGPRPVTLVGINFNPKVRNIDMPVIERVR